MRRAGTFWWSDKRLSQRDLMDNKIAITPGGKSWPSPSTWATAGLPNVTMHPEKVKIVHDGFFSQCSSVGVWKRNGAWHSILAPVGHRGRCHLSNGSHSQQWAQVLILLFLNRWWIRLLSSTMPAGSSAQNLLCCLGPVTGQRAFQKVRWWWANVPQQPDSSPERECWKSAGDACCDGSSTVPSLAQYGGAWKFVNPFESSAFRHNYDVCLFFFFTPARKIDKENAARWYKALILETPSNKRPLADFYFTSKKDCVMLSLHKSLGMCCCYRNVTYHYKKTATI